MTKVCVKCKILKDLSEFNKQKSSSDGLQGSCRACFSEYNRVRYSEKKEHILSTVTKYRLANQDKVNALKKARYEKKSDYIREKARTYYFENKEACIKRQIEWVSKNRALVNENSRRWAKNNPDKRRDVSVINQNRRKEAVTSEKIPHGFRAILLSEQGNKCAGCLNELSKRYHVDHYLPICLGGKHIFDNLQLLCQPCNNRKAGKHPMRWLSELLNTSDFV
jgi:5-methylcytosine-specific restriction endonuclease McrA